MQTFLERYYLKELRLSNIQRGFFKWFSLVTFVTLLIVAGLYCARLNEPVAILSTCGSFSSYAEALDSYNDGNTALDGNHDGMPCNNLYNHGK